MSKRTTSNPSTSTTSSTSKSKNTENSTSLAARNKPPQRKPPKKPTPKEKPQRNPVKLQPNEYEIKRLKEREAKGLGPETDSAPKPDKPKSPADHKLKHFIPKNKPIFRPEFPDLPPLENLDTPENKKLFQEKLRYCRILYDFQSIDENHQNQSKQSKSKTLTEILTILVKEQAKFDKSSYKSEYSRLNLFRTMPKLPQHTDPRGWNPEEDLPPRDPSWIHTKIVYEILFHILQNKQLFTKAHAKSLKHGFCDNLVNNLAAFEMEERLKCKQCLHRIYSNYTSLRKPIMKRLTQVCLNYAYEGEHFLGIRETLELIGTIVSGFAIPLKKENEQLLHSLFLPMFRCNNLSVFYQPLLFNICQFVEKKPKLSEEVFYWLICHWPNARSKREILFMQTIEDVLQITPVDCFESCYQWLCHHLARCISSTNAQVSTKALELWNSDYFVALIATNPHKIIKIFIPHILDTIEKHWLKESRESSTSLLDGMDEQAYNDAVTQANEKRKLRQKHLNKLNKTFDSIEKKYAPLTTNSVRRSSIPKDIVISSSKSMQSIDHQQSDPKGQKLNI